MWLPRLSELGTPPAELAALFVWPPSVGLLLRVVELALLLQPNDRRYYVYAIATLLDCCCCRGSTTTTTDDMQQDMAALSLTTNKEEEGWYWEPSMRHEEVVACAPAALRRLFACPPSAELVKRLVSVALTHWAHHREWHEVFLCSLDSLLLHVSVWRPADDGTGRHRRRYRYRRPHHNHH